LLKVDRTQFLEGVEVLAGMTKRNRMAKAPAIFLYPAIRLLKFNALWKGGR
jgi:hypothetical protein